MNIRHADPEDAPAFARVHMKVTCKSYGQILQVNTVVQACPFVLTL